ncbi:hypothetical protein [Mycolicibacterium iranicum]|uniref:Uncharacterized protein n=1 Tax=Mycolicibacterium iranicum TaxID=912594 RepID=A0ABT4HGS0_MYCIR|nr:hypothetical protein [Mycolicibacterium iranicum]MCZ0729395.1 hypothetical protein [Mycolicibacterium iranicum]
MQFAVEEALDELYAAKPEEFTALRTKLAAAAKKSGDAEAARRIRGSRKPTAAAWVVNAFALQGTARAELTDLGSRLREAHAAMDGEAIRALTAEQRRLVDELTRTALRDSGLPSPSAALRDDVTSTWQAAVADPDVAARLGRLAKAEQWSGFGDFGFTATVGPAPKKRPPEKAEPQKAEPKKEQPKKAGPDRRAVAAAERAKADADAALTELQSDLATARLKHQDAQRRLAAAEQALSAAEDAYAAGKRASKDAADAVKAAKKAVAD